MSVSIFYSPDNAPSGVGCLALLDSPQPPQLEQSPKNHRSRRPSQHLSPLTSDPPTSAVWSSSGPRRCSCDKSSSPCFVCIAKRRHSEISMMNETMDQSVISTPPQRFPPILQEPVMMNGYNSDIITDISSNCQDAVFGFPNHEAVFPGHAQSVTVQVHGGVEPVSQNRVESGDESNHMLSSLSEDHPASSSSSDGETESNEEDEEEDEEEEQLAVRSLPARLSSMQLVADSEEQMKARTFHGVWDGEHDSGFQVGITELNACVDG